MQRVTLATKNLPKEPGLQEKTKKLATEQATSDEVLPEEQEEEEEEEEQEQEAAEAADTAAAAASPARPSKAPRLR